MTSTADFGKIVSCVKLYATGNGNLLQKLRFRTEEGRGKLAERELIFGLLNRAGLFII
jgi:hypothetical protein